MNAVVVAPMPSASVHTITVASAGVRRHVRAATRIVCQRLMAPRGSIVMPGSDPADAMIYHESASGRGMRASHERTAVDV